MLDVSIAQHLCLNNFNSFANLGIGLTIKILTLEIGHSMLFSSINQDHIGGASFKLTKLNNVTNNNLA
jgi:hypothetical protein